MFSVTRVAEALLSTSAEGPGQLTVLLHSWDMCSEHAGRHLIWQAGTEPHPFGFPSGIHAHVTRHKQLSVATPSQAYGYHSKKPPENHTEVLPIHTLWRNPGHIAQSARVKGNRRHGHSNTRAWQHKRVTCHHRITTSHLDPGQELLQH